MNWWVFVKYEPKSSQLKEPKTSTISVCVYRYIRAVKVNVNNALTQINFNATHFIHARLTQHVFYV